MRGELEGRVALVTGAGRGIGRAVVEALAEAGAHVVLAARTRDEIERAAEAAAAKGVAALAVATDVRRGEEVAALFERALERFGRLDALVNNAGVYSGGSLLTGRRAEWQELVDVNLLGVMHCTQAALRPMVRQRSGRVVNVASASAAGAVHASAYAATKAGVIGFTRAVALEVARLGITVNAVCPSRVDTGLLREGVRQATRLSGKSLEEGLAALAEATPRGRLTTVEEVAATVRFLVSDGASGLSGEALGVGAGPGGGRG